jgi:serine acetyltransferase
LSCHSDVTGYARLGVGVLIGSHASVLPGATIGDFATIGAGSVVLKSAPSGATMVGVPARRLM